ncbi:MAG: type II toxin-antitoxin system RelE/ParE family toxin [Algisphaera sp.]
MIVTFACKQTERLFRRETPKRFPVAIRLRAFTKLRMIDAAESISDLRIPPANRLEALKGDRRGQHSIRINQQWRVCFRWNGRDAYGVEIVDYH